MYVCPKTIGALSYSLVPYHYRAQDGSGPICEAGFGWDSAKKEEVGMITNNAHHNRITVPTDTFNLPRTNNFWYTFSPLHNGVF